MAKLTFELLTLENNVFKAYLFWSAILVLKMLFMSLLTGFMRFRTMVRISGIQIYILFIYKGCYFKSVAFMILYV